MGLAAGSSLIAASSANALRLDFNAYYGSTNSTATGASAEVEFSFSDVGDGTVELLLDITNNTGDVISEYEGDPINTAGATASRFMGFGLDWTEGNLADMFNIAKGDYSGNSHLANLVFNDNTISGQAGATAGNAGLETNFGNITFDIGFSKNKELKGGNPNGALIAGQSTQVSLILDSDMDALATEQWFSDAFENNEINAGARFQAVNAGAGSDKLLGDVYDDFNNNNSGNGTLERVPEPGSIAALAFIGGGMFLTRRRLSK